MQEIELKKEKMDFQTKEAYKTLRTNIELAGDDIKVVCVTSCIPNEGKSSTSFELARSFAQNGKKTLLIDADLRKSVMRGKRKSGKIKLGLTNYLAGRAPFEDTLCVTDETNFCMMFAGPVPPNPSELLGNARFRKMVETARETFDIIVIDTPPIGQVIDTAIVSKKCDGIILVIEAGKIRYGFAKRVKEQLDKTGCRILGCVLNKVNLTGKSYYGRYYGKYYGNYGDEE